MRRSNTFKAIFYWDVVLVKLLIFSSLKKKSSTTYRYMSICLAGVKLYYKVYKYFRHILSILKDN